MWERLNINLPSVVQDVFLRSRAAWRRPSLYGLKHKYGANLLQVLSRWSGKGVTFITVANFSIFDLSVTSCVCLVQLLLTSESSGRLNAIFCPCQTC